jgi:arginyl-tRNA synthetase
VEEGLSKGLFARSEDGSVWADLTAEGLGRKVLLRRDGTSVYITQDLGTADLRYRDFPAMTRSIYVIANEQDHHMQVLIALLRRLGRPYADALYHLSYGMVELPTGRMKTREGTVVDADDLLEEMRARARDLTDESIPPDKHEETAEGVGQAAIRFYLLRVEPKKNIVFDPAESIDLKGFTGPFLQYGYVRALRLREKAETQGIRLTPPTEVPPLEKEEALLLRHLYGLPAFLEAAALSYNPALIAHYGYELTQRYNEFYQKLSVLRAEEPVRSFRLALSYAYEVAVRTVLEVLHIPLVTYM